MNTEQQTNTDAPGGSGLSDGLGFAAAALLYEQIHETGFKQKVVCVIVQQCPGDDRYSMRAKAERYMNKERADEIAGYKCVAYEVATVIDKPNAILSRP